VDPPTFVPPNVVRLDAEDSRVPVLGHFRLLPQPAADMGFRYASWRGGPVTLVLEWSQEGFMRGMYVIELGRADSLWAGRAWTASDVRYERPFRIAFARRIKCS